MVTVFTSLKNNAQVLGLSPAFWKVPTFFPPKLTEQNTHE